MPSAPSALRIEGLAKAFGDVRAVDGVDLEIAAGEFFSLLGASGCGKTTLLRLMAGLERPDAGRIVIDAADVTATPPYARPVNMVFQSYALFPHMTVEGNVAFGLKQEGLPAAEIRSRVGEALTLVRMDGFARRRPHELSGGQRQRVALCRALVKRPKILLLDEPLSALDRKLREKTRFELIELQRNLGLTFVMVTHDQEEAMSVSSRIAVMDQGRIVQVGSPREVYERPASRLVADFIGEANIFEARVAHGDAGDVRLVAPEGTFVAESPVPLAAGQAVDLMVRPERVALGREPADGVANCVRGKMEAAAYLGDISLCRVRLATGFVAEAAVPGAAARPAEGEDVWLSWPVDAGVVLVR